MLVYVNKVYLKSDLISYVQIVMHDKVNLKNIYYTNEYNKVVEYCKKLKLEGHEVFPLKTDNFIIDRSVRKVKIEENTLVNIGFEEEDTASSAVYGLYSLLAKNGAVLLSDEYKYEDGYVGLVSEFVNMEISNSNMEIKIPVMFGKEKVSEFKVVKQNGESILNDSFSVAVPSHCAKNLSKTCLIKRGKLTLNNVEFTVFDYAKGASIFRNIDVFEVPEPIIVMYVNQRQFYSTVSSVIERLMIKHNVGSFLGEDKNKLTFSDLFNNYSGVFLRPSKSPNSSDIDVLVDLVLEIGPSILNKPELDSKSLSRAISKTLVDKGLDLSYTKPLLVVMNIYKLSGNELELLNSLMLNFSRLKVILLDIDLYLYSLRIGIYDVSKTLYPEENYVVLRSYSSEVRMEVWRR